MIRRSLGAIALLVIAGSTAAAQAAPAAAPAKPTAAQTAAAIDTMRMEIASARKSTVAANMNLTADEATRFWPVYDAYRAEVKKTKDGEWASIQDYAAHYTMMSDSVAQRIITGWMAARKAEVDVRMAYLPKFAAAVGWTKTGRYFQIENRLDLMLDAARAREVPLAK